MYITLKRTILFVKWKHFSKNNSSKNNSALNYTKVYQGGK